MSTNGTGDSSSADMFSLHMSEDILLGPGDVTTREAIETSLTLHVVGSNLFLSS